MANKAAQTTQKTAIPTYEGSKGIKHGCTIVGASVTQIPAVNLSYRKYVTFQNKHASNVVYIGGGIPYLIEGSGSAGGKYTDPDHDKRNLTWHRAAGGTNEWYLATSAKADPSLSTITYLYYQAVGGSETLGTSGTVGSLSSQHNWGFGGTAEFGFDTLVIKTAGALPANNPSDDYNLILAYTFALTADDTAATGGIELGPRDTATFRTDGTVKIFAIASAATTAVGHIEGV